MRTRLTGHSLNIALRLRCTSPRARTWGESFEDLAKYYANNVIGALHLLNAALSAGNGSIVFSSTCAVYGEGGSGPITEDGAFAPVNPYGRTKLAVEHALCAYDAAYGLRSVRRRYFNAWGCDLVGGGIAVNLGTERGISVREVVDAVERVTGLEVPCRVAARRQGDPAVLVAVGSRAQRLFRFTAAHSDIETIVRTAHAWLAGEGRCPRPGTGAFDASRST